VEIANTLDSGWQAAPLPQQPGVAIQCVRVNDEALPTAPRPVLFVYGFTAGIVANAPFGAALAARGFDVVLPDQNRVGILKNPNGKRDATYNQAVNLAAIIEAEGLEQTGLDVVTHSYGSLIFGELLKHATQSGWRCFEDSKVAMLAPAGIKHDETVLGFLRRYRALLRSGRQLERFDDSYWAHEKEIFGSGEDYLRANKWRALLEAWDIIYKRLALSDLLQQGVIKIVLMPFAEDALYSPVALEASIGQVVNDKVINIDPIYEDTDKYGPRAGRGAHHSDQQLNPERVAHAVAQFFKV